MSLATHCFRALGIATGITWVFGALSSQFSQQVIGLVSLIGFVLSLLSWFGSVYVWARMPKRSFLNYVALPILVLFGFLVGWVYLLFRSDVLSVNKQSEGGVVDVPETT